MKIAWILLYYWVEIPFGTLPPFYLLDNMPKKQKLFLSTKIENLNYLIFIIKFNNQNK